MFPAWRVKLKSCFQLRIRDLRCRYKTIISELAKRQVHFDCNETAGGGFTSLLVSGVACIELGKSYGNRMEWKFVLRYYLPVFNQDLM